MSDRIAILGGTGNLGYGLALRLAAAGYSIVVGSRSLERAEDAAARARAAVPNGTFSGALNPQAAASATRLIVLTVPFAHQATTVRSVAASIPDGRIFLDTTVPLGPAVGGKPTQLVGVWQGSAAQQARALLPPKVGVVSALHTLSADDLEDLGTSLNQDSLLCGDSKSEKQTVREMLEMIEGLRIVDAGRLENSRLVEALTPILVGINVRYKTHSGIRITGLDHLSEAGRL